MTTALRHVVLGAALAVSVAAGAAAAVDASEPGDVAIGSAKAPVTIVEYASVGCSHCAEWDRSVFPSVKAKLLDTGQARLVVREMITGDATIATGGFMVARCAGPAKYFDVVEAIYKRQDEMFEGKAGEVLQDIARTTGGLDEAAFDACIADQKGLDALDARIAQHMKVDKVESTPTFFVGQSRLEGFQTFAQISQAVRAARRH
ncbi:MAG TPA: thioredoxin domain-containing protein [Caulobacteraceae bacterium]|nr:thioredoxin domain-containing protein [Caulobacteraceae bacterium]